MTKIFDIFKRQQWQPYSGKVKNLIVSQPEGTARTVFLALGSLF